MNNRLILHLDMDAFFAAVEQAANPNLKGKPVVICGEGRSVVAAASYEARKIGIKAGLSAVEAKQKAPEAVFIPGHHPKYLWICLKVLEILRKFSPMVEPVSIDEAFVDLSGNIEARHDPEKFGRKIKRLVTEKCGLTCSIGLGSNKLIAKIASDFQKPDGLTFIRPEDELRWMHKLPIASLPGIGPKTTAFFKELNIDTVGQLAQIKESVLIRWFGKNGSLLYQMARGRDESRVISKLPELKSISQEWTLPYDSADLNVINSGLTWLSSLVGCRLRNEEKGARTLTLKIRSSKWETRTFAETVTGYLFSDQEIMKLAFNLFNCHWRGAPVRLLGIRVSNLVSKRVDFGQLSLWPEENDRAVELARTIDELRAKYGNHILGWAGALNHLAGRK